MRLIGPAAALIESSPAVLDLPLLDYGFLDVWIIFVGVMDATCAVALTVAVRRFQILFFLLWKRTTRVLDGCVLQSVFVQPRFGASR